jgi:hypothetical protein
MKLIDAVKCYLLSTAYHKFFPSLTGPRREDRLEQEVKPHARSQTQLSNNLDGCRSQRT